jgi:hypothetical protein
MEIFSNYFPYNKIYDHKILIHLIYIPWKKMNECKDIKKPNAIKCLKDNQDDFNKSYYEKLKSEVMQENVEVIMWTFDKLKNFSEEKQPGLWIKLWELVEHPTMIVDYYRWFVVYHLGGIYLQYDSKLLFDIKDTNFIKKNIMPADNKSTKLFVEVVLTEKESIENGKRYKIRNGAPEEPIRIANQFYSSKKYSNFCKKMLDMIMERLKKYNIQEDYDILYIGANALVSEVYDKYYNKNELELVNYDTMKQLITFSSNGSWRKK